MAGDRGETSPRAVRLDFEYEGDTVRLIGQYAVDLVVEDTADTDRAGYYVHSRNAAGNTLARVPVPQAFEKSVEVFPETPGGAITRLEVPHPSGAFSVVVPVPPGADRVSLMRVLPPPAAAHTMAMPYSIRPAGDPNAVTEIATFPLNL